MNSYANPDNECSICMDDMYITQNYTKTDCGHCFHTTCLMSNVSHNGFNCPNCRTKMSNEHSESYETEDEDSVYENEYIYSHQDYLQTQQENTIIHYTNQDYIMRGLRFFNNNIDGIQHNYNDLVDEVDYIRECDQFENAKQEFASKLPSLEKITECMIRKNITYTDLIQVILNEQQNVYSNNTDYYNKSCDVFGKIKSIIHNHRIEFESTNS
jgi:hypothetical protein